MDAVGKRKSQKDAKMQRMPDSHDDARTLPAIEGMAVEGAA